MGRTVAALRAAATAALCLTVLVGLRAYVRGRAAASPRSPYVVGNSCWAQ